MTRKKRRKARRPVLGLDRITRWAFPLPDTGGRIAAWNDNVIEFRAPAETYYYSSKVRDALWAASEVKAWDTVVDIALRELPKRFKAQRRASSE